MTTRFDDPRFAVLGALALLLLGCSTAPGTGVPHPGASDGGAQTSDGAIDCSNCGTRQGCQDGVCVDLPDHCPCPAESYCDLASNTCKGGCNVNDVCATGRYCDVTVMQCKAGCRTTSECPKPAHGAVACSAGACVATCDSKFHACSGDCKADDDADACGASCAACPSGANVTRGCVAGKCVHGCQSGWADCNNNPGDGCEAPSVACYRDQDGDGFAASLTPQAMCACPSGWTSTPGPSVDCDDTDSRAFPGQTTFFSTPRVSGGYDYNCNGTEDEKVTSAAASCPKSGQCVLQQGWASSWPWPACGAQGLLISCVMYQGSCYQDSGGFYRAQECR